MALEKFVVETESRRADRGLVAGVGVAISFLVAAVIMVLNGQPAAGTVIGTVDIVSLVGVFVYGNQSRRKEREGRVQALTGGQGQR